MERRSVLLITVLVMVLSSCERDNAKLQLNIKNGDISIFHEQTEKLIIENSVGDIQYSSDNELIAKVSNDGIVTGGVKGVTKITVTSGNEIAICNVEVKTKINFIPEPYLRFGESYDVVKNNIKNDGEIIEKEKNLMISKTINGSEFIFSYAFVDNQLKYYGFKVEANLKTIGNTIDFLLERYIVDHQLGALNYGFISPDKETFVRFATYEFEEDDSDTIIVTFMPFMENSLLIY